jgi:hypothetical protein
MHHSRVQVYDSYSLELTVSNAYTACVQPRAGSFLKNTVTDIHRFVVFYASPAFHVSAIVLGVDGRDTFIIFTQCVHRFRESPPTHTWGDSHVLLNALLFWSFLYSSRCLQGNSVTWYRPRFSSSKKKVSSPNITLLEQRNIFTYVTLQFGFKRNWIYSIMLHILFRIKHNLMVNNSVSYFIGSWWTYEYKVHHWVQFSVFSWVPFWFKIKWLSLPCCCTCIST